MKTRKRKAILRRMRDAEMIHSNFQSLAAIFIPLAVVAVIAAVFALVWFAPLLAVEYHLSRIHLKMTTKDALDFESNTRTALAQLLGGLTVLVGSYIAYRNLRAVQKNIQVSEEGQITERFTRAVDQLGSDKLEVRLGGIYSLERIAGDSERDHRTIMEILSAYVRVRREIKDTAPETQTACTDTEVQAILTVMGRRDWTHELDEHDLSFRNLDLHGLSLKNAYLEELPFDDSNLNHINFEGAKLEHASFRNASLEGAKLKGLDLSHVDFEGAKLANADLTGCNLVEALNLTAAQVYYAYFDDVKTTDKMREEMKNMWRNEYENPKWPISSQLKNTQKAKALGIQPVSHTTLGSTNGESG